LILYVELLSAPDLLIQTMDFFPQGVWRLFLLASALLLPFLGTADTDSQQASQDGECGSDQCGSDRSVLLQLSGVLLDSTGKLASENADAQIVKKVDDVGHPWTESHRELLKDMKVKFNTDGDLTAVLTSLVAVCFALVMLGGFFCAVYRRYPLVYTDNVLKGVAPMVIPDTCLGWIGTSWNLTSEQIEKSAGLDAAMFIEFVTLALRVMCAIGIPMVLILCPLHIFAGGSYTDSSSGEVTTMDKLGKLGMGNIQPGEGVRWMYWVHALFIWYVVYVTQAAIFQAQEKFLAKRFDWLLKMPKPRSTSVLVEGIPEEFCNDDGLMQCFCRLFPNDRVESAYVVRKTATLSSLVENYKSAEQSLAAANFQWQALGSTQDTRPTCYASMFGGMVDKITYYEDRRKEAAATVLAERARLKDPATDKSEVYSSNGFVTFRTERDAMIAMGLKVRSDEDQFMMSTPPDPADIRYEDLYAPPARLQAASIVGYACTVAVFFSFTPIILAISSVTNLAALRGQVPALDKLVVAFPMTERLLEGVLASAALTLFMSFLPTVLNLIFVYCFQLKAGQWVQQRIQIWYFWFQIIFVLLVTAVGSSLLDTMLLIIDHPTVIFSLLAERLPSATHFYLNFMIMQWVTHGLNLTRYVNLFKFKAFSSIFEEQRAKELSEPEDQDYYGIGGRSARFTINLVIALVYCSLCPLITVVTGINFVICKVVYSYLLVFAEGKKPDLGGHFWVAQLRHVQHGLFIYVVLMVGVLSQRAASYGPTVAASAALLYLARQYSRFHSAYEWEVMPFEEFVTGQHRKASWSKQSIRESSRASYAQPELTEPELAE
jgi:hypothetical protein